MKKVISFFNFTLLLTSVVILFELILSLGPENTIGSSPLFVQASSRISQEEESGKAIEKSQNETLSKLPPEQKEFIEKYGFLITNQEVKQIFEPYTKSRIPMFITADSILTGYNVLFEESFRKMEENNARKFPEFLEYLWDNLEVSTRGVKDRPELNKAAKERDKIIIGVALRLAGSNKPIKDKHIESIVNREVKLCNDAQGIIEPGWIKADEEFKGIDYSRFKSTGFYTQSPELSSYFKAVRWLQQIPFRPDDDVELAALVILCEYLKRDYRPHSKEDEVPEIAEYMEEAFICRNEISGSGDNRDMYYASGMARDGDGTTFDFNYLRGHLEYSARNTKISYQRHKHDNKVEKPPLPRFTLITPLPLPDSVMFEVLVKEMKITGYMPSGIETGYALGSEAAGSIIKKQYGFDSDKILEIIDKNKKHFEEKSLYVEYLQCLKELMDKPDKDMPDFMKTSMWQLKSLQTALSGWSMMRHSMVLHEKFYYALIGRSGLTPGFVEPYPEFYSRLADLSKKSAKLFSKVGIINKTNEEKLINCLEEYRKLKNNTSVSNEEEENKLFFLEITLRLIITETELKLYADKKYTINQILKKIDRKKLNSSKTTYILDLMKSDLSGKWEELNNMCSRLESISNKQLRGKDLTENDALFIEDYGKKLAKVMLYEQDSYLSPKDDAPRIADIAYDPVSHQFQEVATARPRIIYVLYPWKGKSILCKGAVMTYCDFKSPTLLNDEEWREKIRKGETEKYMPEWTKYH
ncbi:MAG: DUF3160 domain-containing protein [Firmicutes bacterium]|nr:DUF3160 domain-containing protein [Bacillota bacterium]